MAAGVGQLSGSDGAVPQKEQAFRTREVIGMALGVILILGSLAAAGILYAHSGTWQAPLGIAVGGVAAGILLSVVMYRCRDQVAEEVSVTSTPRVDQQKRRTDLKEVYQETLRACGCNTGYQTANGRVTIDHEPLLSGTVQYSEQPRLSERGTYTTAFSVRMDDTLNVLTELAEQNPVGINMANAYHPGGGVARGCTAQEEEICRRSNHILGLQTQAYPLPEFGGIYCPHVQVFRDDKFNFMAQPIEVALVAVAAYDLRNGSRDLTKLGLSSPNGAASCERYKEGMREKIKNMLRVMAIKGHTTLVLGALGCGAFENSPEVVAQLFREVFQSPEFKGRFKEVVFAILKMNQRDQANIDAFTTMCTDLTPKLP